MVPEVVVIVAHWQTSADDLDTVLGFVAELTPRSLAEPGCLGYEALQDADDPTRLVLVERYRDRAALEAHLASPHYQELVVGGVRPLLTDRRVSTLGVVDIATT
ncbi:antibiotic biosynthesis monooxygenase [Mycobacterium yunnanensis]|uniref:Antibiotic biosynthesis monooxygenase n=1 Tax=Mycobacterium yunnanensis TaxID=368477 RepID=A0A9X3BWY8_9MYCO|nr:putative quinol monooxygenase [Mycobacterium yunnanensis]MCV7424790.1 antibiotic biosynthesis monooxygenase [Mycobacterium yunnanensis]